MRLLNEAGAFPPRSEVGSWSVAECREVLKWLSARLLLGAQHVEPPPFVVPFVARSKETADEVRARTFGVTRIAHHNKPRGSA